MSSRSCVTAPLTTEGVESNTFSAPARRPACSMEGSIMSTLDLLLVLFVALLLALVAGLVLGGLAYLTHRHPRLEKPLGVALGGGALLVAVVAVLVAVVALTR